jgi:hypothetical protein
VSSLHSLPANITDRWYARRRSNSLNLNWRWRSCVVKFVLETDSPRLTGFELAEAGAAACSERTSKLRALAVDQGYGYAGADALVAATIKESQRDALAALAARDQKNNAPKRDVANPIS